MTRYLPTIYRITLQAATGRWRHFTLRLLCAVSPHRPLYQLVPSALVLAALIQLVTAAAVLGGLLGAFWSAGWPFVAAGVTALLIARARFGLWARTGVIALVILVSPNPAFGMLIRLILVGLITLECWLRHREYGFRLRQFLFKPFEMGKINQGPAGILRGTVHIVHVFVDDRVRWRSRSIKRARSNCSRAQRWLIQQAARFDVPLEFAETMIKVSRPRQRTPDSNASMEKHAAFGKWLQQIIARNLSEETSSESPLGVVVHLCRRTRSYAVPMTRFCEPVCPLEYTVMGAPHRAADYAHELLHLFGADDYYEAAWWGDQAAEPWLRTRLLGQCIMFSSAGPLDRYTVDDLSAQKIGWK